MRLIAFAMLLAPIAGSAQVRTDSTILVSSTRNSRVVADRASLYVTVDGTAETPTDALSRVEVKLRSVSEALQRLGAAVEIERPISYGVATSTNQPVYGAGTPTAAYVARSVIRVQLRRVDQLSLLQAAVLAAGAGATSGVVFESSVADSVRRARLADAVVSAKADAETLATTQGLRLGPIIEMSTNSFSPQTGSTFLNFDSRVMQQVPAPEVVIGASVSIRYRVVR